MKQTALLASPVHIGQAQEEEKKHLKRGAKFEPLASLSIFWVGPPSLLTAIRTLRLETSKRGRLNAPHLPSSAGSSQRNSDAPTPNDLPFHLLTGEC